MNLALFAIVFLALTFVQCQNNLVQDAKLIEEINAMRPGWRAGQNSRFNNVSMADAVKLLGLTEAPVPEPAVRSARYHERLVSAVTLPDEFDSRKKWPQCVMPIRDQKGCGGCWSFAGNSVFSTRLCIQTGGAVKVDMAPQYAISCDSGNTGCNGGTLGGAWSFFQSNGCVADYDYPFTSATGNSGTCALKPNAQKYYAGSYTRLSSVAEMQQEIYDNGAIQVGFDVYQDFYSYKSGVYTRTSNVKAGGHSVYLVGWGIDGYGVKYWIAINSWSSAWGISGAFYIRRGTNECNIETGFRPVAGVVRTTVTTRAPTPTTTSPAPTQSSGSSYDTRGCWTCPAGWTHWFAAGMASAPSGDKCACVPSSSAPTTRAPAPAPTTTTTRAPSGGSSYDTRGCWTCHAGYIHWFAIGMSSPPGGDSCACVPSSSGTTTRAPTPTTSSPTQSGGSSYDTRGCWTCPANYIHWFAAGMASAPNGDRCACVVRTSNTIAPATPSPTYNTRGCWTCPANYTHWFQKGLASAPGGDACACIPV